MSATLRALGQARWTVLAFAIAGFATAVLQSLAYFRMAGHTVAERAAFGYSLSTEAVANAAVFSPPFRPDTVAGYVELRAFGPLAILFAAWALVAATGSRSPQIVSRAAAFAISVMIAAVAACIGVLIGVASGGESVGGLPLVEAGVLLVALAIACYAICLLVAQLTPAATVVAGGLLLTLYFLNSLSRIFTQLDLARWLSPFRYYDLSTPLPPGGHFDLVALAMLVAIAAVGIALAAGASARRVGGPVRRVPTRTTREPSGSPLLGFPVARGLYSERIALAAWCVAFVVLGIVLVAATRSSMQDLLSLPRLLPGLPQYIFVFYAHVLGQTWFDAAVLMLAALTFGFVARWAAEDRDGRLEAELSAPYSRSAVVLERLGALALTTAVLAALSGLSVAFTSRSANLALDPAHLVDACLLLVLFSVVMGAAGSLLISWVPRAAPALFVGFVLASYLDDQIGGALGLPGWAQGISAFRLVGAPLTSGIDERNLALLLLLALAGLGSSILVMQRRDVGA
jgi:ABC-2 type transport system permease protein